MTIKGVSLSQIGLNTGKSATPLFPGLAIAGILVPYNWTMAINPGDSDATVVANLEAALTALLLNDSYAARAQYIGPFEDFQDKSEAPTFQTLGYGKKVKTQRKIITKQYQLLEGGAEYYKAVQTYTGKINQYKWVEIDNKGNFHATETISSTGVVTGIQGCEMTSFEPLDINQAEKGKVEEYMLQITLANTNEVNENRFVIETGTNLNSIVNNLGIYDVNIAPTGLMVAKVVDCAITAIDGGINLCSTVPGLIVGASFIFTNTNTGSTVVTLTSVAIVNGKARFTFAGTGAGWVPGNNLQISLVAVSVLSAAGFKYYECNSPAAVGNVIMVA